MSPRYNLLFGVALLALAVMETLSGQALGKYGRYFEREDDPKNFWGSVAVSCIAGLFFIGRYVYQAFLKLN